jgi:hypothetical protein
VRSILRGFAEAQREEAPRPFYSLRAVADHFHIPLSTARHVFQALSEEGLLVRVRGSQTMLQGRSRDRSIVVRGVIGLPVSVPQFTWSVDYQSFGRCVRRELRRHGFITAIAYYTPGFDADTLAERLQQARADTVLWYLPDRVAKENAPHLKDLGIETLGIGDAANARIPCRYRIEREGAMRAIAHDWRRAGIRSARIAHVEGDPGAAADHARDACDEVGLATTIATVSGSGVDAFLSGCVARTNEAVVLLGAAGTLCLMRSPDATSRLLQRCRVGLFEGPIAAPLTHTPDAPVDLVTVDWQAFARGLREDLLDGPVCTPAEQPLVVHAEARLRVLLRNTEARPLCAAA